jgi:hypothetical protein
LRSARPEADAEFDDQEDAGKIEGGALDREPKQAPKKGADDSQHD